MAELWSDYTDLMITNIDKSLGNKYRLSIREFLKNPAKYANQANIETTVSNLKDESDKFMDGLLEELQTERKALETAAAKADSVTGQLLQNISMQSKQNKTPMLKPVLVDRNETNDVVIYVDNVEPGLLSLVEKLSQGATFIADNTTQYKDYNIGEWVFGGENNYVLRAYLPRNQALQVENSRGELDILFDTALDFLKSAKV